MCFLACEYFCLYCVGWILMPPYLFFICFIWSFHLLLAEAFRASLTRQLMYVQRHIPHTHTHRVAEKCLHTHLNCPDPLTSNRNPSQGRIYTSPCMWCTLKGTVLCVVVRYEEFGFGFWCRLLTNTCELTVCLLQIAVFIMHLFLLLFCSFYSYLYNIILYTWFYYYPLIMHRILLLWILINVFNINYIFSVRLILL